MRPASRSGRLRPTGRFLHDACRRAEAGRPGTTQAISSIASSGLRGMQSACRIGRAAFGVQACRVQALGPNTEHLNAVSGPSHLEQVIVGDGEVVGVEDSEAHPGREDPLVDQVPVADRIAAPEAVLDSNAG